SARMAAGGRNLHGHIGHRSGEADPGTTERIRRRDVIILRAAVFTHDPACTPFAGQRRRTAGDNSQTRLVEGSKRRLIRNGEQVGLRVGTAVSAKLLAEKRGVAHAVDDVSRPDLAQKIENSLAHLAGRYDDPRVVRRCAAVAKPGPLVPDIVVLARPIAA